MQTHDPLRQENHHANAPQPPRKRLRSINQPESVSDHRSRRRTFDPADKGVRLAESAQKGGPAGETVHHLRARLQVAKEMGT